MNCSTIRHDPRDTSVDGFQSIAIATDLVVLGAEALDNCYMNATLWVKFYSLP